MIAFLHARLAGWKRGRDYSRHLSKHELDWAARQDDDLGDDWQDDEPGDEWGDTLHGWNQEPPEEFTPALCAPGCQGDEHRYVAYAGYYTDLEGLAESPWPQDRSMADYYRAEDEPDPDPLVLMHKAAAAGDTRRAENLRLMHAPGTRSFYPYGTDLPGPDASTGLADPASHLWAGEPRRRRRPWSGLFGGPNPINVPGQVGRASDTGHLAGDPRLAGQDGDGALTGEIVTPPAPSITININIVHVAPPAKWLLDELARRDAEVQADIARRNAEFAKVRNALAWSGQLELTAGAA